MSAPSPTKRHEAEAIARRVNAVWAKRGHDAQARAVLSNEKVEDTRGIGWVVVSNLVNGVPRRGAA
jgi:hypothetical protein